MIPAVTFMKGRDAHTKSVNCVRFSPSGTTICPQQACARQVCRASTPCLPANPRLPVTPTLPSPGELLASCGDDMSVIIWKRRAIGGGEHDWLLHKMLRGGHVQDIFDLSWSLDLQHLMSVSIDASTAVWAMNASTNNWDRCATAIKPHQNFVQGCAWDPAGEYVATQSCDRTCRLYQIKKDTLAEGADAAGQSALKFEQVASIAKRANAAGPAAAGQKKKGAAGGAAAAAADAAAVPTDQENGVAEAGAAGSASKEGKGGGASGNTGSDGVRCRMFMDDTVTSFFRRLTFSPDGLFLVTPTGQFQSTENAGSSGSRPAPGPAAPAASATPCVYMFARGHFDAPLMQLQSPAASVAVRFSPMLYRPVDHTTANLAALQSGAAPVRSWTDLPHRMVFAVATLTSVVVYDTQHTHAIATVQGTHFTHITDVAWSASGNGMAISSSDGFVTLVAFDDGELGEPLPAAERPAHYKHIYDKAASNRETFKAAEKAAADAKVARAAAAAAASKNAAATAATAAATAAPAATGGPRRIVPMAVMEVSCLAGSAGGIGASAPASTSAAAGGGGGGDTKRRIQPMMVSTDLVDTGAVGVMPLKAGAEQEKRRIVPTAINDSIPASGSPSPQQDATAAVQKRRIQPSVVAPSGAAVDSATEAADSAADACEPPTKRRIQPMVVSQDVL